ncbi:hypothetical protein PAMP_010915 [Pampus punctatissimus]
MFGFNRVGVCSEEFDTETFRKDGGQRTGLMDTMVAVMTLLSAAFILLTFPLTAWRCVQVVQEYERAVIFRLGRVVKASGSSPGWTSSRKST